MDLCQKHQLHYKRIYHCVLIALLLSTTAVSTNVLRDNNDDGEDASSSFTSPINLVDHRDRQLQTSQQQQRDYAAQYEECLHQLDVVALRNSTVGREQYLQFVEHVSKDYLQAEEFLDLPVFLTMIFFSTACTSGQNCVDYPPFISVKKKGIAFNMMNYFCRQVYQYPFVQVVIPFEYLARHYSRLNTEEILEGANGNTIVQDLETATTNLLLNRFNCSIKGQRRLDETQLAQEQSSSPFSEVAWATTTTKTMTIQTKVASKTTIISTPATVPPLSETTSYEMRQPLREYLLSREQSEKSVRDASLLDQFVRRTTQRAPDSFGFGTRTPNPFCDFQVDTHITDLVDFGSICNKPVNLGGECVLVSSTVTVWAVVNDSFESEVALQDYITDVLRSAINGDTVIDSTDSRSGSSSSLILEDFIPSGSSEQFYPVAGSNGGNRRAKP